MLSKTARQAIVWRNCIHCQHREIKLLAGVAKWPRLESKPQYSDYKADTLSSRPSSLDYQALTTNMSNYVQNCWTLYFVIDQSPSHNFTPTITLFIISTTPQDVTMPLISATNIQHLTTLLNYIKLQLFLAGQFCLLLIMASFLFLGLTPRLMETTVRISVSGPTVRNRRSWS